MPNSYAHKTRVEVLRGALQKLQAETPVTSIGAGSVARALAESVTREIGDLYAALDFNTSQSLLSSATGSALDLIGELYNVTRKQLSEIATVDQSVGSFYFYLDQPHTSDVTIPVGTEVYTDQENFIGDNYAYRTTQQAVIPEGRTRVFVGLVPMFNDSVYTAGANTLVKHNATSPTGTTIRCTNPKPIAAQLGYESDDNFRTRIIKSIRVTNGATSEAVRFAGLQVPGVRDIKIRNLVYGLGSVEAVVVPENVANQSVALNGQSVVSKAVDAMKSVSPVGIRLITREPKYSPLDITGTVIIKSDINVDRTGTAGRARIGILRYLNTLLPGDTLVYARLLQSALESSDRIVDVNFTQMQISSREVLRVNYRPEEFEQIVPGRINLAPA